MDDKDKQEYIDWCKGYMAGVVATWHHAFKPTGMHMKDPNRKWMATSCMQKAIRRGNAQLAINMADGITTIDPEYFWNRINVIALEDIGFGNFSLVIAILWVTGNSTWRKKLATDQEIMHAIIRELCASWKDRTVTDLAVWVDSCPETHAILRQKITTCGELFVKNAAGQHIGWVNELNAAMDQTKPLADRMVSAWAVSGGGRFKGEFDLPLTHGDYKRLVGHMANTNQIHKGTEFISSYAASKLGDALPISMLFCDGLYWQTETHDVVPDEIYEMPMLGNYASETFDWFCREGKRALDYWVKNCKPIRELFEHCEIPVKQWRWTASALIFRVEGAKVDRRARYNGSDDIFKFAEIAMLRRGMIPTGMCDVAMKIAYANLDSMHWARKKVLDLVGAGETMPKQWWVFSHDPTQGLWGLTTDPTPLSEVILIDVEFAQAENSLLPKSLKKIGDLLAEAEAMAAKQPFHIADPDIAEDGVMAPEAVTFSHGLWSLKLRQKIVADLIAGNYGLVESPSKVVIHPANGKKYLVASIANCKLIMKMLWATSISKY